MKQERIEKLTNDTRMLQNSLIDLKQQEDVVALDRNGKHSDKRIPKYQEQIQQKQTELRLPKLRY